MPFTINRLKKKEEASVPRNPTLLGGCLRQRDPCLGLGERHSLGLGERHCLPFAVCAMIFQRLNFITYSRTLRPRGKLWTHKKPQGQPGGECRRLEPGCCVPWAGCGCPAGPAGGWLRAAWLWELKGPILLVLSFPLYLLACSAQQSPREVFRSFLRTARRRDEWPWLAVSFQKLGVSEPWPPWL